MAVLGVTAYRTAFGCPKARIGPQEATLGGARLWILPNPSGLNAHYTAETLAAEFRRLRRRGRGGPCHQRDGGGQQRGPGAAGHSAGCPSGMSCSIWMRNHGEADG